MSTKIAIIASLERLWPHDDDDSYCFSLNLSTAFDTKHTGSKDDVEKYLLPWEWRGMEVYVGIEGQTGRKGPYNIENYTIPAKAYDLDSQKAFLAYLITEMKDVDNAGNWDVAPFVWDPNQALDQGGQRTLYTLQAYVSTLAAPVPQKLNLSLCFRIPKTDLQGLNDKKLYAAPGFSDGSLKGWMPSKTTAPDKNRWDYENPQITLPVSAITAYEFPFPLDSKPENKNFFDFKSYWVKKAITGGASWYSEDWATQLESKVAEAFDLPQRLIDFLREMIRQTKSSPKDSSEDTGFIYKNDKIYYKPTSTGPELLFELPRYRRAVVAGMRDLAGVGLLPAANQRGFVDDALARCGTPGDAVLQGQKASMRAALMAFDQTLTFLEWHDLLRRRVPELLDTQAWQPWVAWAERPLATLAEELEELEAIQSTLADERVLRPLVLAQWEAAAAMTGRVFRTVAYFLRDPGKDTAGLLNLGDESTWTLTLTDLDHTRLTESGSYQIRFIDQKTKDDTFPEIALDVDVEIEKGRLNNKLSFRWIDGTGADKITRDRGTTFDHGGFVDLQVTLQRTEAKKWKVGIMRRTLADWETVTLDNDGVVTTAAAIAFEKAHVEITMRGDGDAYLGDNLFFTPPVVQNENLAEALQETTPPGRILRRQSFFASYANPDTDAGWLNLGNGEDWAVTVAGLNHRDLTVNSTYRIIFTDDAPALADPPGDPRSVELEVEKKSTDKLTLQWQGTGASNAVDISLLTGELCDLRFIFKMDKTKEKPVLEEVRRRLSDGSWTPIDDLDWGTGDTPGFTNTRIEVKTYGTAKDELRFIPPSAVHSAKLGDTLNGWDQTDDAKAGVFWSRFAEDAGAFSQAVQLRKRLAHGNVGRVVCQIINTRHSQGDEKKQLTENLTMHLVAYYHHRYHIGPFAAMTKAALSQGQKKVELKDIPAFVPGKLYRGMRLLVKGDEKVYTIQETVEVKGGAATVEIDPGIARATASATEVTLHRPSPYRDYAPRVFADTAPLRTAIDADLKTFIDAGIETFIPGGGEADTSPTPVPHALTFQIDRVACGQQSDDQNREDLLRQIAGIGVLMRQKGDGDAWEPWRCLNMAEFRVPWYNANKPVTATIESIVMDGKQVVLKDIKGGPATIPKGRILAVAGQARTYRVTEDATVTNKRATVKVDLRVYEEGLNKNVTFYATVYDRAVVPYRLPYKDGVRQAFFTYDNQPLIAESRALELARRSGLDPLTTPEPGPAPWKYVFKANWWAMLPGLKFGQSYQVLCFIMGASGALPKELSYNYPYFPFEIDHPARIKDSPSDFSLSDAGAYLREVQYLRRVRLGTPRLYAQTLLTPKDSKNKLCKLPPIPDQVAPLFPELPRFTLAETPTKDQTTIRLRVVPAQPIRKGDRLSIDGDSQVYEVAEDVPMSYETQPVQVKVEPAVKAALAQVPAETAVELQTTLEDLPLLLLPLGNEDDPFEFGTRKPATDLQTWDRWTAKDGVDRKGMWAAYHHDAEAAEADRIADDEVGYDLTIDDPAVARFDEHDKDKASGSFVVELHPLFPTPGKPQEIVVPIPKPAAGQKGLRQFQAPPVNVVCERSNSTLVKVEGGLKVFIKEGDIVELRVSTPVEAKYFDEDAHRRFPQAVAKEGKPFTRTHEGVTKKYYLFSPWRMVIEAAIDTMPDQETLWQAIEPEFIGSRVRVHLDPSKDEKTFRYVSRIDLMRQTWRWQGRPVASFPDKNAAPDKIDAFPTEDDTVTSNVFLWEAQGFADRGDDDHLLIPNTITVQDQRPQLLEEDLSEDRRALFYRFAARAYSRYYGLSGDYRNMVKSRHVVAPHKTRWRRLLVPCRWAEALVPKPVVKFVVPLTEAAETKDSVPRTANLLVVLNEPWYSFGGLREKLEARVVVVETEGSNPKKLDELGPDPILSGKRWPEGKKVSLEMEQPIGHTFDTDADAPLFVASSFRMTIRDTSSSGTLVKDFSWYMAKVHFRRSLTVQGKAKPIESAFTDPFWVQFLPDASLFKESGVDDPINIHDITIEFKKKSLFELCVPDPKKPDKLKAIKLYEAPAEANSANRFERWLLLTEVIRDVRGIANYEKYIGLFRLKDPTSSEYVYEPFEPTDVQIDDKKKKAALRVRVLEVQQRQGADVQQHQGADPKKEDPWEALFPAEEDKDAGARIVRVSPPIEKPRHAE